MSLLVLNAGSSSLRFALFSDDLKELHRGHLDNVKNYESALKIALKDHSAKVTKVAHRVVHGGEQFKKPTKITPQVLKELTKLSPLAPLHNPANILGIKAAQKAFPKAKHYAIFDTAFHQSLPQKAYLYGLPYSLYQKQGIRRYGFHGTSHKYVASEAAKVLRKKNLRLITCHLGNGVSLSAIENGICKDTSMGFTPLEGPMMGTRSGSIDPAIIFHLLEKEKTLNKKSLEKLKHLLENESGFLGLSGFSSDIRELWAKPKHPGTLRTFDVFSYQIAQHIGKLLPALSELPHAIVFTAGIGMHAYYLRAQICDHLKMLGIKLKASSNQKNKLVISSFTSKIKVLVLPTNEELQMAREISTL